MRLILEVHDEAVFAGTFAHAVVHIAEHHIMRLANRGDGTQLATIPMIFLGGCGQSPGLSVPLEMLPSRRTFESETDLVGPKILAGAGFDPEGFVNFIARVQEAPGSARRPTRL